MVKVHPFCGPQKVILFFFNGPFQSTSAHTECKCSRCKLIWLFYEKNTADRRCVKSKTGKNANGLIWQFKIWHTCLGVLSDLLLHHSQSVSSILRHSSCDSLLSAPSNTDDVSVRLWSWWVSEGRQLTSPSSPLTSWGSKGQSASASPPPTTASNRSSAWEELSTGRVVLRSKSGLSLENPPLCSASRWVLGKLNRESQAGSSRGGLLWDNVACDSLYTP